MLAGRTSIRGAVRRGDDGKTYQDSLDYFHVDGSVTSVGVSGRVRSGSEVVQGRTIGKATDARDSVSSIEAEQVLLYSFVSLFTTTGRHTKQSRKQGLMIE